MAAATIRTRLEISRKELLDLGLRNTLLNYRLMKARGIQVEEALGAEVFQRLVLDKAEVSFAPQPSDDEQRHRIPAHALLTAHDEKALQSRLLATYRAARTHIEERGVNILFIAIGMLHWYEEEASQQELRAPLLLIPVELSRTTAVEKFTIQHNEEDVEDNLSLAAKLKAEFAIDLPVLPEVEELDVNRYFDSVARKVVGQKRWRVERDEIALGFFSFAKFLMYKDLEPDNWCDSESPDATPVLAALLRDGFKPNPSTLEDAYLDKLIAPNALRQVSDVDSSQALAMLDVRAGKNLVIQGPPGTGKSQTITNLIADAVSDGKSVLFVAEKLTALEVVKRRLDKVHLGDACLELHSHAANKKAVLQELKRTLMLGRPNLNSARWSIDHYKRVRDELNAYCLALNTPLDPSGWTPHRVMGELLKAYRARGTRTFPSVQLDDATVSELITWPPHTLDSKQELVVRLQSHVAQMGVPSAHPFRGSRLEAVLPSDLRGIGDAIREAQAAAQELVKRLTDLRTFTGLEIRANRAEADILLRVARRALGAPRLSGLELRTGEWLAKSDDLRRVLDAGSNYSAIHAQYDEVLIPEAWTTDLLQTRQVLNTTGRKWWRWLSSDYRAARRFIGGLCRGDHPKDVRTQLNLIDCIMETNRLAVLVMQHEPLGRHLFGVQWQGVQSDWTVLKRLTEWVTDLHRDVGDGRLPKGIIDFLAGAPSLTSLKTRVDELDVALGAHDQVLPRLFNLLQLESGRTQEIANADLTVHCEFLATMLNRLNTLSEIIILNNQKAVLTREGLAWVWQAAWDWSDAHDLLLAYFRAACLEPLLRLAYEKREALRSASGSGQRDACESFCKLDGAGLRATQAHVAIKHHEALPDLGGYGQVGVLAREFEKRSRHLPIRKLVAQAGNAIQAIKPVFMMSPISVAAFAPSKAIKFDLVIFDEASQVKPVDAFGAVLRGAQLVVVGDDKQLPPTSFFDSFTSGAEEEEVDEEENVAANVESILGMAAARGVPQRMLRWHYRSRHHSLIELSNRTFYDNRLVVFPSPEPRGRGLGLVFHHLPKTSYDRGGTRTNQKEAEVVARAVMAHAKSTPHLTLGVAAFSITQADAISEQLENLRRADPSAEPFFGSHTDEPFFVKNLENVQGDERDIIFISVGYGRTEDGSLAMHFGAVNTPGGERRLNVLITRARSCCEVFSNVTHTDVDLNRSAARGVAVLKEFLRYAQHGSGAVERPRELDTVAPFEDEIAEALRRENYDVVRHLGSGSFRLDIAVRDPQKPDRFVLGIQCDGASYHAPRSTRDRDRLREEVLRNLGWTIHRVWSTDWFQNSQNELRRLVAAIEAAKLRPARVAVQEARRQDDDRTQLSRESGPRDIEAAPVRAEPYVVSNLRVRLEGTELHEVSPTRFADWIEQVVGTESPIHRDEVVRRIADAAGVQRVGNRIAAAFDAGISAAKRSGKVRAKGSFLWSQEMTAPAPRDRGSLPAQSRKIELVAPEELGAAICRVVSSCFGIELDAIPTATSRLLGFARTSDEMSAALKRLARKLIDAGQLQLEGDHVTLTESPS